MRFKNKAQKSKELQKERLFATKKQRTKHMHIDIEINKKWLRAMIDSSATENFMTTRYARYHELFMQRKTVSYLLTTMNKSTLNEDKIDEEVRIQLLINELREEIIFDIIKLINYDVILRLSWLRKHNSIINWIKEVMHFEHQKNLEAISNSTTNRNETTHQKVWEITRRQLRRITRSDSNSLRTIWVRSQQSINVINLKDKVQFSKQYNEYKTLFEKNEDTILSEHRSWDHEIRLKKDKQSTFESIYQLSSHELEVLKNYIEINLRKKFIKSSQSSARYSILFAFKKNEKLRLCVNYRQLNNITIKNRYALSLISKLKDRTHKIKIFTKIDLREEYHRIRMEKNEEWKIAFKIRYEHYEYQVISFDLTNASTTFQAFMNKTLREYLNIFVIVYLDDILVYFEDEKTHTKHVRKVLKKFKKKKLLINSKKCS